jgi:acyl-CoA synthetase (NDP forming)
MRDLTSLFEPETLAIVGVSADPAKWGYWFARDAALGKHRRRVYLVGRNGGHLHGLPVHRSLGELPEAPELVILSVPANRLEEAVDESLAAGARALVAIAAGFAELGEEGAARERALVERVRAAGAALVGPNCLGIFDGAAELQLASVPLPPGPVGCVSQSGNVLLEIGLLLEDSGLGFSRAVSGRG